jgi:hypothetical protein
MKLPELHDPAFNERIYLMNWTVESKVVFESKKFRPFASRKTRAPLRKATKMYTIVVMKMAKRVPSGMDCCGSFKSPEMFAPAKMPVAAGK